MSADQAGSGDAATAGVRAADSAATSAGDYGSTLAATGAASAPAPAAASVTASGSTPATGSTWAAAPAADSAAPATASGSALAAASPASATLLTLPEPVWRAREAAHRARVAAWTDPHLRRRAGNEAHPVMDFLFTYYSHRPARLLRWHPGAGVVLAGAGARERLQWRGYLATPDGVALGPGEFTDARRRTAEFVRALLTATAGREPRLACFGLHEWAMVYRLAPDEVRHSARRLRLGSAGTDQVVETQRIRCSHHDAYRFFTPDAAPLNTLRPTRDAQVADEQPGCLHAGMDLYKWAYKLDPFVPSELIADCFALAAEIREMDMRASPYDLSELGYTPIPIETPAGRAEYAAMQAEFAQRGAPLRQRLIDVCDALLTWAGPGGDHPVDAQPPRLLSPHVKPA